MSHYLCMDVKIYVALTFGIAALVLYYVVEYLQWRNSKQFTVAELNSS